MGGEAQKYILMRMSPYLYTTIKKSSCPLLTPVENAPLIELEIPGGD